MPSNKRFERDHRKRVRAQRESAIVLNRGGHGVDSPEDRL